MSTGDERLGRKSSTTHPTKETTMEEAKTHDEAACTADVRDPRNVVNDRGVRCAKCRLPLRLELEAEEPIVDDSFLKLAEARRGELTGAVVGWTAKPASVRTGIAANLPVEERIGRVSHVRPNGDLVIYDPDGIRAVVAPDRVYVLANVAGDGWANLELGR